MKRQIRAKDLLAQRRDLLVRESTKMTQIREEKVSSGKINLDGDLSYQLISFVNIITRALTLSQRFKHFSCSANFLI